MKKILMNKNKIGIIKYYFMVNIHNMQMCKLLVRNQQVKVIQ